MSEKLQRLQRALKGWQLDGVLLTRRDNIAWLTQGASYSVVERAETGVASLLVKQNSVLLLAPENELPRILAEEPLPFDCEHHAYPWYTSLSDVLPRGCFGSDVPQPGLRDVQPDMVLLRQGLNADEQHRYRALGRDAAEIVQGIARQLRPGITEYQVEAQIAAACLAQGIRPVCTLVAADERIAAFKHPVPTHKTFQRQLLITLGAERAGLHVSLTRMVHVGALQDDLRQRIHAVARIHAAMLAASQTRRSWAALFTDITRAYQQQGYPDAWQAHHQGGPAGYGCRDFILTPDCPGEVGNDIALAWNPTLSGVKSEDTFLLTSDGLAPLTRSGDWPMIGVQHAGVDYQFADWLVLPAALPEVTS